MYTRKDLAESIINDAFLNHRQINFVPRSFAQSLFNMVLTHPELEIEDLGNFISTIIEKSAKDKINPDVRSFPTEQTVFIMAKDLPRLTKQLEKVTLLQDMLLLCSDIYGIAKEYGYQLRESIISGMQEIFAMHENSLTKKPRLVGAQDFSLAVNVIIDPNKAMMALSAAIDSLIRDLKNFKATGEIAGRYKKIY